MVEDGQCVVKDVGFPLSSLGDYQMELAVKELRWNADWAGGDRVLPPANLVLDMRQIATRLNAAQTDGAINPVVEMTQYQNNLMAEVSPANLSLEIAFDDQAKVLDLKRLEVDQVGRNGFTLQTTLRNIDLGGLLNADWHQLPPLDKLVVISVDGLDFSATNGGFFESMSITWLSAIYPALGDSPEAAVENAKLTLRDAIAQVPDGLLVDDSRDNLLAVVNSIPHPLGTLHATLDTADGLVPAHFATSFVTIGEPPTWDNLAALLQGATLKVDWTPLPPPG